MLGEHQLGLGATCYPGTDIHLCFMLGVLLQHVSESKAHVLTKLGGSSLSHLLLFSGSPYLVEGVPACGAGIGTR